MGILKYKFQIALLLIIGLIVYISLTGDSSVPEETDISKYETTIENMQDEISYMKDKEETILKREAVIIRKIDSLLNINKEVTIDYVKTYKIIDNADIHYIISTADSIFTKNNIN